MKLLSSVVMDGENGLKLEEISQFFQVLKLYLKKSPNSLLFAIPTKIHDYHTFFIILQHFVYELIKGTNKQWF